MAGVPWRWVGLAVAVSVALAAVWFLDAPTPVPAAGEEAATEVPAVWTAQASLDAVMLDPVRVEIAARAGDLVVGLAQEGFSPAEDLVPTGVARHHWRFWFYEDEAPPEGGWLVGRLAAYRVADSGGAMPVAGPGIYVRALDTYWKENRVANFIDSNEAALLAYTLGGEVASVGRDNVLIDYRLHAVEGQPRWDVVYRDPVTRQGFFAISLDAETGLPIQLAPSWRETTVHDAIAAADATAWRPDASLLTLEGVEGPQWDMAYLAGGQMALGPVPAGPELVLGDDRATTWMLQYYSPAAEELRMFLVVGGEVIVEHNYHLNWAHAQSVPLQIERRESIPPPVHDVSDALTSLFSTNRTHWTYAYSLDVGKMRGSDEWRWQWTLEPRPQIYNGFMYLVDAHNLEVLSRPAGH